MQVHVKAMADLGLHSLLLQNDDDDNNNDITNATAAVKGLVKNPVRGKTSNYRYFAENSLFLVFHLSNFNVLFRLANDLVFISLN